MEGLHGVMDLQFSNRSDEDSFGIEIRLNGRLLPEGEKRKLSLNRGQVRKRTIALHLPRGGTNGISSAGDARFDIEVVIDAGEEGRHRFIGEFTLAVLAYTRNRSDINVNINKIIEQHGDKAGMGAINEVDLSNFIKIPSHVTVNDLIRQDRPDRFVAIELEYEGEAPPSIIKRDGESLTRCSIVNKETETRLLILTGDSVVLGKNRGKADIVTWIMPRDENNDHETRKISGEHCRLSRTDEGLAIGRISSVNPTTINGQVLRSTKNLQVGKTTELCLPAAFKLYLTPLPLPVVSSRTIEALKEVTSPVFRRTYDWSERTGIGGLLIRRTDGLADKERYLWLMSLVNLPLPDEVRANRRPSPELSALAMPGLHLCPLKEGNHLTVADRKVRAGSVIPVVAGDSISVSSRCWQVGEWDQQLDV